MINKQKLESILAAMMDRMKILEPKNASIEDAILMMHFQKLLDISMSGIILGDRYTEMLRTLADALDLARDISHD